MDASPCWDDSDDMMRGVGNHRLPNPGRQCMGGNQAGEDALIGQT